MEIFKINDIGEAKILVLLPDKICKKSNAVSLNNDIVKPSGLSVKDFAFLPIPVPKKGKIKKDVLYEVLETCINYCQTYGIKNIVVGHSDTWASMTGKEKFTENFGNVINGKVFSFGSGKNKVEIDFSTYNLIPLLNPVIVRQYPNRKDDLVKSLNILPLLLKEGAECLTKEKEYSFENVILTNPDDIKEVLAKLRLEPFLFVDIETTGLNWYKDDLLTISFTSSTKEAYCIAVNKQYHSLEAYNKIIDLLRDFFQYFLGSLVGHNWLGFDQCFIIHEVMRKKDFSIPVEDLINIFDIEDTMLMAYLLLNSTERVSIGLKTLAFKYLGDWDKGIDQSNLINTPLEVVAKYNNLDVIATKFVYDELIPQIKADFEKVYNKFKAIGYTLLKMKMQGMRIDYDKTQDVYNQMEKLIKEEKEKLENNPFIKETIIRLAKEKQKKAGNKKELEHYIAPFNAGSPKQKQVLFFDVMNLPVVKTTATGSNATDKETFNEWLANPKLPEIYKETLNIILEYSTAEKVRNTYLKNMLEGAIEVKPNDFRIFANFNQAGTISGRLSSSGIINMQTIPSNSKYGKLIKSIFIAPDNYYLASSDYGALEDRLMANASKDPNKIAPFKFGIDGHCLNAYSYFKDKMPLISERFKHFEVSDKFYKLKEIEDKKDVWFIGDKDPALSDYTIEKEISKEECRKGIINSIKILHPDLRQEGKPYTFGFSYGANEQKYGEDLYKSYWKTYIKTKEYNNSIVEKAKRTGEIISRYSGLRLLVPDLLSKVSHIREKAERVVANFNIQSGNILTLYAMVTFQRMIENYGYVGKVIMVNTIHDAIYLYVENNIETIKWVNNNLIKAMINSYNVGLYDDVSTPLTAELDIGFNMAQNVTLPNNCSEEEIKEALKDLTNQ